MRKFFDRTGLTQTEIGEKIGYSQVMVGRYLNCNSPNYQFITAVTEAFPEIDWNYLFKSESELLRTVKEEGVTYGKTPEVLLEEIDVRLEQLKKWHKSDTEK